MSSSARLGSGQAVHFFLNGAAILIIGFVLLRLYQFVWQYEAIYEYSDSTWNATQARGFPEPCKAARPFIGEWLIYPLATPDGGFPYTRLHLRKDLVYELGDHEGIKQNGNWKPPDFFPKTLVLRSEDGYRFLELREFDGNRMLLHQTGAYIGGEELRQTLQLELQRIQKPE